MKKTEEYYYICKGIATYMLNTIDDYEKVDDEYLRAIIYEWLSDMARILDKYLRLHEQAYKQQYNEPNENPIKETTLISYAMFKFLSLMDNEELRRGFQMIQARIESMKNLKIENTILWSKVRQLLEIVNGSIQATYDDIKRLCYEIEQMKRAYRDITGGDPESH